MRIFPKLGNPTYWFPAKWEQEHPVAQLPSGYIQIAVPSSKHTFKIKTVVLAQFLTNLTYSVEGPHHDDWNYKSSIQCS